MLRFASPTPPLRYGVKQRIAHGLLVLSVTTGLMHGLGLFAGSAIAMLGIEWKFSGPVFFGDTIRATIEITNKRLASSGDRGMVERTFAVINQRGEIVQRGAIPLMVRVRPRI